MQPILLLSVAAILVSPTMTLGVHGPIISPNPRLSFTASCGPDIWHSEPWMCEFTAKTLWPSLIFFRWDFDNDGEWDTGSSASGHWTSEVPVRHAYHQEGLLFVCVQAWDGFTSKWEGGTYVPIGPVLCHALVLSSELILYPNAWDRGSTGRVTLTWDLPLDFTPKTPRAQDVTVNGVHATAGLVFRGPPGEPILAYFYVDRVALSAGLSPGTYDAMLRGTWDDAWFFAHGEFTIR